MKRAIGNQNFSVDFSSMDAELNQLCLSFGTTKIPVVSIILANYLRSEVLEFAIKSVLIQSFQNWELLIIGDNTDRSSELVISKFKDPRVYFVNLSKNFGDQSGPNSVGLKLARGKYIAFLSQDDLWFPWHLENALDFLQNSTFDAYLSHYLTFKSIKKNGSITNCFFDENNCLNSYNPCDLNTFVATSWVISKSATSKCGSFKPASKIRYASSQEYLFRLWASGARIFVGKKISSLVIPSISQFLSYKDKSGKLHEFLYETYMEKSLLPEIYGKALKKRLRPDQTIGYTHRDGNLFLTHIQKNSNLIFRLTSRIVQRLNVTPFEFASLLLLIKKGEVNKILRRGRGLPL